MITGVLSWIFSGGLSAITAPLERAYKARLEAQNDAARLKADIEIRNLEARRDSILAAQRDRFERWVRIGFAFPFIVYNAKLVLWDKVLGWGVTDPLSPELAYIQITVLGGYFFLATAKAIRK